MRNSMSPNQAKGLTASSESLRALKPDELAERWRSFCGSGPPARLRRPLLIQALAYRSQKAFGGLKAATRRLLESVAGDTGAPFDRAAAEALSHSRSSIGAGVAWGHVSGHRLERQVHVQRETRPTFCVRRNSGASLSSERDASGPDCNGKRNSSKRDATALRRTRPGDRDSRIEPIKRSTWPL
jgi:hypothetical protein